MVEHQCRTCPFFRLDRECVRMLLGKRQEHHTLVEVSLYNGLRHSVCSGERNSARIVEILASCVEIMLGTD